VSESKGTSIQKTIQYETTGTTIHRHTVNGKNQKDGRSMTKLKERCSSYKCKNKTIGGNSYKDALCKSCYANKSKILYLTCKVCKKSMLIERMEGGPRKVCSDDCAKIRRSIRSKKFYLDNKPPKKICKYWKCEREIRRQGKKVAARKFCTELCYKRNKYWQQKYKRACDKQLSLIKGMLLAMRLK
tara:strand:+ start:279 stop:836 length:558 start_codon:yes stop_codon:yes gene_type:complete